MCQVDRHRIGRVELDDWRGVAGVNRPQVEEVRPIQRSVRQGSALGIGYYRGRIYSSSWKNQLDGVTRHGNNPFDVIRFIDRVLENDDIATLGLAGAWVSVGRLLASLEP